MSRFAAIVRRIIGKQPREKCETHLSRSRSRSRSPRRSCDYLACGSIYQPSCTPPRSSKAGLSHGRASVGSSQRNTRSRTSFAHRDFANPNAETCWLSCLFQSIWHSVVFHSAFEKHLDRSKYVPGEDERIITALQHTWSEYKAKGLDSEGVGVDTVNPKVRSEPEAPSVGATEPEGRHELLPRVLAEAFGDGYGDMSEALALVQEELSQSPNPFAAAISASLVLIPVAAQVPTPELAWRQVVEWQVATSPLIAVDLCVPAPTKEGSQRIADKFIPADEGTPGQSGMGPDHHLVALVCFMHNFQHYVTFCRRQRNPSKCVFFNDLPTLTSGAEKEISWSEVPSMCGRFSLCPRLALYESESAADQALQDVATGVLEPT